MEIKRKKLLRPARLIRGDTIGIVAPASPFDKVKFNQGIVALESMGFRTSVSDDLFITNGYLAGTDRHRANMVNRLFADKTIKAVVCAKGGFGSLRMLSLLDFQLIGRNPKIFVGFSDISALLFVLFAKCGLVTFHGPMVTTLADATEETKNNMFLTITSDIMPKLKPKKGVTIKPGIASGPVAGGNLTTLCHLAGTPYTPNFKGQILLLEDKGEAAYRIDRMLSQMKLAGCFDGLNGLALGSFEDCGKLDDIFLIVDDIFKENKIPILAGFEIGHGTNNFMVPMGLMATLDANRQRLVFNEPATVSATGNWR
ncbi:MAG: LD-carboxypeptidase [Desulfobacterales bacterium]